MADKVDIDSAMDDFDLLSSSPSTNKNTSFAPSKPSRFRPKPKGGASTSTTPCSTKLKTEQIEPIPIPSTSTNLVTSSIGTNSNPKPDPEAPPAGMSVITAGYTAAMDVDEAEAEEEEDVVVREIDVFFTPPAAEDETKLYVMQYPLRPRWRPYDLSERCTEVRIMPKRAKMELDLSLDTGTNNFDRDFSESMGIDKQTLSSQVAPCPTDYAVGVLRDNQIYLNPIHSVVQMRPVVRSDEQKRKRTSGTTQQTESAKSLDSSLPSSSKTSKIDPADSKQIKEEEEESWVSLEFHTENSDLSVDYAKKMAASAQNIVDFKMNQSDYMGSLCPATYNAGRKESFRRVLMKLPLEERIKQWLTKKTVNSFEAISFIFAPDSPSSEILNILQSYAYLIHGLWVTKSSVLYSSEGHDYEAHVRDFILLQFSKGDVIPFGTILKEFGSRSLDSDFQFKRIFDQLTVRREVFKQLKFRFSPDLKFGKRFPEIVKEQEKAWMAREEGILENLRKFGPRGVYRKVHNANNIMSNNNNNNNKVVNGTKETGTGTSTSTGMSGGKSLAAPETRKFLLEALAIIFEEQKVRTVQSVVRDLREMAKRLLALPKESSKNKQLIEASLKGAENKTELQQEVIKQLAVHMGGGVYELRKEQIMEFATNALKREIKELEYSKVVEDICVVTEDGGLVLKSGD